MEATFATLIIKYVLAMTPKVCKENIKLMIDKTVNCVTLNAKKWWSKQINISVHIINQTVVRSLVYINQFDIKTALVVIE